MIGLGYVGLPLLVEFAKRNMILNKIKLNRKLIGFDINKSRVNELKNNFDKTNEISKEELSLTENVTYTTNPKIFMILIFLS